MRELSIKCHQNGLAFSVDDYVPMPYNTFYDLEEQSVFADYVVIMGYDEHVEGSYEAGSVASYGYVKDGIENALKSVPKEKLINAIPLYTRLWFETPKTQEELASEAGTEAADYPNKVTSTALGMEDAENGCRKPVYRRHGMKIQGRIMHSGMQTEEHTRSGWKTVSRWKRS